MQLRKLVLACGFASFALSNYASALGLGDVKLNSTLNQPLNAEIKLLDTRDLSPEQILIALASPADFERNGVDRLYFYTEFQFQVDLNHAGGPIIRVTTKNSVREPYLNFLIEARWSAGRLLREYTVLMDLPTFDSTAPKAVQAPEATQTTEAPAASKSRVSVPAPEPTPAPVQEAVRESAPVASATPKANAISEAKPDIIAEQDRPKKKSKVSAGSYGPISDKDRLWDIAKAVRPDSSVSVHQTMLALQRLNPDAFIRGNINLLKKGQVLRVPDASEAASVSKSDAVTQVNAQNSEWSGTSTSTNTTAMGAQLDASRRTTSTREKSEPVSGRVKLEASSTDKAVGGRGSGSDKAGGKGLESELSTTLEELDKAKSENTELSSRVHELEEQIKTMQKLADVSNEKMRALQLTATKNAEKASTKTASEASIQQTASAAPVQQASAAAQPSETVAVVSSSAAVVEENKAVASAVSKKKIPAPQKIAEKSLFDQLSDNLLWVALGVVGLGGVGGAYYMRKRKEEEEEENRRASSESESFYEPEPNFNHLNESHEESTLSFDTEQTEYDEEDATVVAETDDVVSEADIYISLGKYHQAEDMLLNALETNPEAGDIHLKLLEVYSHTQNITEFDKHYAALLPMASPFAVIRASELRSTIADAGVFNAHLAEANVEPEVSEDFALDLDDASADSNPVDENLDVTVRRYDMDFSQDKVADSSAANVSLGDDEFVLDFDDDEEALVASHSQELSDISLALDGLENHKNDTIVADDIYVATLEDEAVEIDDEADEEISFNFNELESDDASELSLSTNDDSSDDFNLEMDVDDVDLAALDREMESLDSEPELLVSESESLDTFDNNTDLASTEVDDELDGFDALFEEDTVEKTESEFNETEVENSQIEEVATEKEIQSEDADLGDWSDELSITDDDEELVSSTFDVNDENADDIALDSFDENEIDTESDLSLNTSTDDEVESAELETAAITSDFNKEDESESSLDLSDDDSFDLADGINDVDFEDAVSIGETNLSGDDELDLDVLDDESADSILENLASESDSDELNLDLDTDLADLDLDLEDEASLSDLDAELQNLGDASEESVDIAEETVSEVDDFDDDVFDQALSEFSAESLNDEVANMSEEDLDAELDFMADADESATKLDLARAYLDMGDHEGARDILAEVAQEGNEQQRSEAVDLISRLDV